jgi:phage protein D
MTATTSLLSLPSSDTDAPPDLRVTLDGAELSKDTAACLLDASITQRVEGEANSLTLRLDAWDSDRQQPAWIDDQRFEPGAVVEVEMGYMGAAASMFEGEIVGYDLEISGPGHPVITIHAYDYLHRLGRGQRNRPPPPQDATFADIVQTIANDYSLGVDLPDTASDPKNKNITQVGRSDLEFLRELAHEIGYELFAVGKKLTFRESRPDQAPALTLDAGLHLVQFSATLSASNQYGTVEVRSSDTSTKQTIKAVVQNDPAQSTDGQFGQAKSIIIDDVTSLEQANARAQAELSRIRSGYITASGTCFGRTDLVAGVVIEIVNIARRFDGRYYVKSATHSISPAGGYRTSFSLTGEPR